MTIEDRITRIEQTLGTMIIWIAQGHGHLSINEAERLLKMLEEEK